MRPLPFLWEDAFHSRDKKSSSAYIIGWHNHQNAGDDAMLLVIMKFLREHAHASSFKVASSHLANLTSIDSPGALRRAHCVSEDTPLIRDASNLAITLASSTIVFGGGSIFHSANSLKWKLRIARLARLLGKPTGALGVSLGPFPTPEDEALCRKLLENLSFVCVRDKKSYTIAKQYNSSAELIYLPDLAILLPQYFPEIISSIAEHKERALGISLCKTKSCTIEKDLPYFAETIQSFLRSGDLDEIHLIDFCADPNYGENDLHRSLANLLSNKVKLVHHTYTGDPLETLKSVSACRAYIGMRLHSQLFCLIGRVPFVAVPYHIKSHHILRDIHLTPNILSMHDLTRDRIGNVLAQKNNSTEALDALFLRLSSDTMTALQRFGGRLESKLFNLGDRHQPERL